MEVLHPITVFVIRFEGSVVLFWKSYLNIMVDKNSLFIGCIFTEVSAITRLSWVFVLQGPPLGYWIELAAMDFPCIIFKIATNTVN